MSEYKSIHVQAGSGGFGGPLTIPVNDKKNKIVNITGGTMSAVAETIAEMSGGELIDGFKTSVPEEEIACVIIDCGGTLRAGLYPKKGIYTINLMATGQSGPMANFITEDIYVSAVKPGNISYADEDAQETVNSSETEEAVEKIEDETKAEETDGKYDSTKKITQQSSGNIMGKIGSMMGNVVSVFYQAGR